jgi:rSAM/selenodomain-associated transferase 1
MRRLLLFAKRPRPGKVKTRLSPPLDARQAASLYRGFVCDLLALLRDCAGDYASEVWWDGPPDDPSLAGLDVAGLRIREQPPGDLGRRLASAFCEADVPTVVIGADSPTIGRGVVDRAFEALSELRPVVIQPALDGGYVLLGQWRPRRELFRDIPWGESGVCEATLRRAEALGLRVELLPPGYDVDDGDGLRRLEAELADPAVAARAPATLRALRLLF